MQQVADIRAFLDAGGAVLFVIAIVAVLMWFLLVLRMLYLLLRHSAFTHQTIRLWRDRSDRHSGLALMIRRQMLAEANRRLNLGHGLVGGLIALCPILGLLGTVSGMIAVFDVVAAERSADPRAMADGIARATLPTLAGIVVALSGLGCRAWIGSRVLIARRRLEQALKLEAADHATS